MLKLLKNMRRKEVLMVLLCTVLVAVQVYFDLRLPDYMTDLTTLIKTSGATADILSVGVKMLGCTLASAVLAVGCGYLAAKAASGFSFTVREKLFRHVMDIGSEEMQDFSVASLITRTTNDITQIQMIVAMGLQVFIKAPITAVWAITKIAGKGVEWTEATGVAVLVLICMIAVIIIYAVPKFRRIQGLTDNLNRVTRENLTGLRVVRAYNAEAYQERKFDEANRELTDTQLFTNRSMAIMMPLMNTVMNGLMLAVYWIGAYLIQNAGAADRLTLFSNMVVFSSYSVQVIMAFLLMSMVFVLLPRADVSARRVLEVIDTKPTVVSGGRRGGEPGMHGTVEFRGVGFTYPGSREPMLRDVSFVARPGQTVAFIGSTGSGKSTLVNLVPRFYDATEGQVLVDGVDVRDYDIMSLRDRIGYVPQKSVLFSGTVSSNIAYGDRRRGVGVGGGEDGADLPVTENSAAADPERVRRAARIAQAEEFIDQMEGGYEARISQDGDNVSGGQKQRLSIARAVYRDPSILVFDDSFSALDFRTDRAVREALKARMSESTVLLVAQRVGTIMDADRIVVLDDGQVVGQGTHRELLATCEVYRQIAESQLTESELGA